jgi:hypothetical protein
MDFLAVGKLQGPDLSEQGPLRFLIRKFLAMTPVERQRCSIVIGDFTYRCAEIEALSKRPDFLGDRSDGVLRFRPPPRP